MPKVTEKSKNELLHSHELRDITELLIKHHGLSEGFFDLGVEFLYAIGPVGIEPNTRMPGGIFGIQKIGLVPAEGLGPSSVDAAQVNPAKTPKKRPRKTTET